MCNATAADIPTGTGVSGVELDAPAKARRFIEFRWMSAFDRITSGLPPRADIPGTASDFRV